MRGLASEAPGGRGCWGVFETGAVIRQPLICCHQLIFYEADSEVPFSQHHPPRKVNKINEINKSRHALKGKSEVSKSIIQLP